jgi:hypothetical protein
MIRLRASWISNKDLIGPSGWTGMRAREKQQMGQLKLGKKFPWTIAQQNMRLRQHGINISSQGKKQCKLSICLEE